MAIHTLKLPPLRRGFGGGFNTQNNTQFLNLDCHESLRDSRNDKNKVKRHCEQTKKTKQSKIFYPPP